MSRASYECALVFLPNLLFGNLLIKNSSVGSILKIKSRSVLFFYSAISRNNLMNA